MSKAFAVCALVLGIGSALPAYAQSSTVDHSSTVESPAAKHDAEQNAASAGAGGGGGAGAGTISTATPPRTTSSSPSPAAQAARLSLENGPAGRAGAGGGAQ